MMSKRDVVNDAQIRIRQFERDVEAGLICWYDTDPAVATRVATSVESVYSIERGAWELVPMHKPVCELHLAETARTGKREDFTVTFTRDEVSALRETAGFALGMVGPPDLADDLAAALAKLVMRCEL